MDEKVSMLRKESATAYASADPVVARVEAGAGAGLLLRTTSGSLAPARMTRDVARVPLNELVGAEVLVLFEGGDQDRPIAVAVLQSPRDGGADLQDPEHSAVRAVVDDGEELVIDAKKRIRLQCGKGSITITRDGKIVLRGTHLLSRSSGPIRIKGGHVDVN